jgi:hypothetical protein
MKSTPESTSRWLFAFVGATVIRTLSGLAVLELVMFAAWSFARWVLPPHCGPRLVLLMRAQHGCQIFIESKLCGWRLHTPTCPSGFRA